MKSKKPKRISADNTLQDSNYPDSYFDDAAYLGSQIVPEMEECIEKAWSNTSANLMEEDTEQGSLNEDRYRNDRRLIDQRDNDGTEEADDSIAPQEATKVPHFYGKRKSLGK